MWGQDAACLLWVQSLICVLLRLTLLCCMKYPLTRDCFMVKIYHRADSRLAPSQWETSLQCNAVSYWPSANLESALYYLKSRLSLVSDITGNTMRPTGKPGSQATLTAIRQSTRGVHTIGSPTHWPPSAWSLIWLVPHIIGPQIAPIQYPFNWSPNSFVPRCTSFYLPCFHWSPNVTLVTHLSHL